MSGLKITAPPRSDQWNAEDFTGGPRTFTIADVKPGKAEQKYDIELVEGDGRVWRPPLTVLRLLIAAWGDDSKAWQGQRVTLYLDPEITFGQDKVGGIRVSHLSGISGPLTVALSVRRGRRAPHTVLPLIDDTAVHRDALTAAKDMTELQIAWAVATKAGLSRDAGLIALKDRRKAELAPVSEGVAE